MKTHKLKTWPEYFQAVWEQRKTFEIRNNEDRGFQVGDKVELREYDPNAAWDERYSGREIHAQIGYVTGFSQKDGYVVFSLKENRNIEEGDL